MNYFYKDKAIELTHYLWVYDLEAAVLFHPTVMHDAFESQGSKFSNRKLHRSARHVDFGPNMKE